MPLSYMLCRLYYFGCRLCRFRGFSTFKDGVWAGRNFFGKGGRSLLVSLTFSAGVDSNCFLSNAGLSLAESLKGGSDDIALRGTWGVLLVVGSVMNGDRSKSLSSTSSTEMLGICLLFPNLGGSIVASSTSFWGLSSNLGPSVIYLGWSAGRFPSLLFIAWSSYLTRSMFDLMWSPFWYFCLM